MYFRQFFEPDQAAMSYLLADPATGQAVAIDPRPDPCQALLLSALLAERHFDLGFILLTHTFTRTPTTACPTSIPAPR
jgi:glyoxylase-like metal-dependent hydrolase (beta-lactamase superfamily II)